MLKKCEQKDFKQIYYIGDDRLSPDGMGVFLLASSIYMAIALGIPLAEIYYYKSYILFTFGLIYMVLQGIFVAFFISPYNDYKYQKLESIVVSIVATNFSMAGYAGVLIQIKNERLYQFTNPVLTFFIIGILITIIATLRAFKRVEKGYLRKNGPGIYNFQKKYEGKGVNIAIIIGAVAISRMITKTFKGSNYNDVINFWIFIIVIIIIQYAMALALPEIYIITYCKFRFSLFIYDAPEFAQEKMLSKNNISKYIKNNIDKIRIVEQVAIFAITLSILKTAVYVMKGIILSNVVIILQYIIKCSIRYFIDIFIICFIIKIIEINMPSVKITVEHKKKLFITALIVAWIIIATLIIK